MKCRAFERMGFNRAEAFHRFCRARRASTANPFGRKEFPECVDCPTGRAVKSGRLKNLPQNAYLIYEAVMEDAA